MHREIWFIVYSCLFLVLLYRYFINRHAESCQFVAFLNSYFYRRILLTRGDLPICGIRNQSYIVFFSFHGWHILKNSIMVQFSRLLYEILNGATIFEKQILFLAASYFGIPDPHFGLYYVYIYHQVFFI